MNYINATPHSIVLYNEKGDTILASYPSVGEIRLVEATPCILTYYGVGKSGKHLIPIVEAPNYYDIVSDINIADLGVDDVLIVSMPVSEFLLKMYPDKWFFTPDTGPNGVVRNSSGQIIGTKRLRLYTNEDNFVVALGENNDELM